MGKTVIIAEKPSVAASIAKVVGAGTPHREKACGYLEGGAYQVTWAFGHLVGLDSPEQMGFEQGQLPMIPRQWSTHIIKNSKEDLSAAVANQMKTIDTLFRAADRIIVATDAGREGELIFRYIYEYLGCRTPFERLWISSLTDEAIRKGLSELRPGSEMDSLSAAAHARSEADWLVGFNASRALRIASGYKGILSLGRVQTPVLCMICDRFEANRDFKPTPFWQIKAEVHKDMTNVPVLSDRKYPTEQAAAEALAAVNTSKQFRITDVQTKDITTRPPLLYDLTALQRAANSRLGLTADETLRIAQSLYERKYLSYPRTGSRYIPEDVFKTMPSLIAKVASCGRDSFKVAADALRGQRLCRRSVNDEKVTDHHALLPTEIVPTDLTGKDRQIWEMVCGRMLEAFGEDSVARRTTVSLECASVPFKTAGSVPVKAGWKSVFGLNEAEEESAKKKDDEQADGEEEINAGSIPEMHAGEVLPGTRIESVRKTDKPLPIYTDSSLLGEMETCGRRIEDEELRETMKDVGLGTPATRAATIETLIARGYVVRNSKKLLPTELGLGIAKTVRGRKIADVKTTGEWERELGRIETGKTDKSHFDEQIVRYVQSIIEDLQQNCSSLEGLDTRGEPSRTCPLCGRRMLNRKFSIDCDPASGGCSYRVPREIAGKRLPLSAVNALCEGRKTSTIQGFKSKSGKSFAAALVLNRETGKLEFCFDEGPTPPQMQGRICPCCGKPLTDGKWSLECECGFAIKKSYGGKSLDAKEIDALLSGNKMPKKGMKSKDGKLFNAILSLDREHRKIAFTFEEKKKR